MATLRVIGDCLHCAGTNTWPRPFPSAHMTPAFPSALLCTQLPYLLFAPWPVSISLVLGGKEFCLLEQRNRRPGSRASEFPLPSACGFSDVRKRGS